MKSFRSLIEEEDHLAHMPKELLRMRTAGALEEHGAEHLDTREMESHHLHRFQMDPHDEESDVEWNERHNIIRNKLKEHGWKETYDDTDNFFSHPSGPTLTVSHGGSSSMFGLRIPK